MSYFLSWSASCGCGFGVGFDCGLDAGCCELLGCWGCGAGRWLFLGGAAGLAGGCGAGLCFGRTGSILCSFWFGCGFSGFFSYWFGVDCLDLESVLDLLLLEPLPEPDLVKLGIEVVFCSCCWLALPLFFGAIHTAIYTPIPAPISVRITNIITSFCFFILWL